MNKPITLLTVASVFLLMFSACNDEESMSDNPFLTPSSLPFEAPNFDIISIEHYRPAFEAGMEHQLEEIDSIATNPEAPTFENTIIEMEKAGKLLGRVSSVFYNLTSAHTNEDLQKIQSEMAPKLAAHSDNIYLNSDLFDGFKLCMKIEVSSILIKLQ